MTLSVIEIPFWTLWEDMQVLLCQFLELEEDFNWEDYHVDESIIRVYHTDITPYLKQVKDAIAKGHLEWDDRGPAHVVDLAETLKAGDYVPPIIYSKAKWMDGRHRMLAADSLGIKMLPGMDFDEWKSSLVKRADVVATVAA